MKEQKLKIFIINLQRSVKRRESIESALKSVGLDYEIVPAVDGKCLTEEQKALNASQEQNILPMGLGKKLSVSNPLTPAEFGCALSHLSIYQKILDSDLDYACVMEDDNLVNPRFLELIEGAEKYKDKWDLVICSDCTGTRSLPFSKKLLFGTQPQQYLQRIGLHSQILDTIFNAKRCLYRLNCYFINRKACKTIIEIGYPIRVPADYLTGNVAVNGLRVFKVFPTNNHYYCSWDTTVSDIATGANLSHDMERM